MPFSESGTIRCFRFNILAEQPVVQAIFTRRGGVSPAPYASLNVGGTVGDALENVLENRRRAFQAAGREPESACEVWQVHSAIVHAADQPRRSGTPYLKADAVLTDQPGVTLFMRFADCVPIFLLDPHAGVVGLVHAGWRGTISGVARAAVQEMIRRYGSRPADILAGIGPSIGPDHYQIGPEVVRQVDRTFGDRGPGILRSSSAGVSLDLWAANRLLLEEQGVHQVEVAGICNHCFPLDWYSHRGEGGRTGRFGALIALQS